MKTRFKDKTILYEFYLKRKLYRLAHFLISDERFLKSLYKYKVGEKLNLGDPRTFNEKIQWLKLNERKDLYTLCADKYAVREYVSQRIGDKILNELFRVYDRVEDIDLSQLPDAFVLKVNHGSGQNIICHNKDDVDWPFALRSLKIYLNSNHYYYGKEWAYKNIKPRIICEKLLVEDGREPKDYKIYCFNGKPKIVQVDTERFTTHKRILYDLDWKPVDVSFAYPKSDEVAKPIALDSMIAYATELSRGFAFVRVDFYCIEHKVFFGEMTFYPDNGTGRFSPIEYDRILGESFELPVINPNDLQKRKNNGSGRDPKPL